MMQFLYPMDKRDAWMVTAERDGEEQSHKQEGSPNPTYAEG